MSWPAEGVTATAKKNRISEYAHENLFIVITILSFYIKQNNKRGQNNKTTTRRGSLMINKIT
jgi:hypothetical protein